MRDRKQTLEARTERMTKSHERLTARIETMLAAAVVLCLLAPVASQAGGRIAVHPPRAEVMAGGTCRFETGTVPDGEARWEVIPPGLGFVDGTGSFVAGKLPGKGIVRVLWEAGTERRIGHAVIVVSPNDAIAPVAILPETATLHAGEEIDFALVGEANTAQSYQWVVDPPSLGRITGRGLFRAGNRPGDGRVFAFLPDDPAGRVTASIRVLGGDGEGTVADVRIVPPVATVPVGEEVRFTIPGLNPGVQVIWSVVPPGIGMITPDGVFRSHPHQGLALDEIYRQEGTIVASVPAGDRMHELHARVVIGTSDLPARIEIDPPAFRAVVSPLSDFSPQPIRFRLLVENASITSELPAEWRVVPEGAFDVQPRFGPRTWLSWVGPQDGNAPNQSLAVRVEARITLPNGRVIAGSAPVEIRVIDEHITLEIMPRNIVTTVGQAVPLRPVVTTMNGISVPLDEVRFEGTVLPSDLGTFDRATGVFHPNRAGTGRLVVRATSARFPALFTEAEVGILVRQETDEGGRRR